MLLEHFMAQTNSKQQWLDWIDEQEQSDLSVGDLTIYLPLDKPFQAADVIKALQ